MPASVEVFDNSTTLPGVSEGGGVLFLGYFLLFWTSGFLGAAEGGGCYFVLFSAILGSSATP